MTICVPAGTAVESRRSMRAAVSPLMPAFSDLDIVALLPEHRLQLRRERLVARYAIAGGIARPERDDAHRRRLRACRKAQYEKGYKTYQHRSAPAAVASA